MQYLFLTLALIYCSILFAQPDPPNKITEANILIESEPSYGFQIGHQMKVFKSGKFYGFYAGGFNSFLRTDESVREEGTSGSTIANILGGVITGELRFLKSKSIYYSTSIFLGWGYRKTNVRLQYPEYDIDRKYEENYHLLATGIEMRAGYRFKNKWGLQFFAREDFSRMIDRHRAILGEKPGFTYGIGGCFYW